MAERPNYRLELVGVFGHPVAENPTVVMQEAAFQALGLPWRYLTIEVLPRDLEAAMKGLRAFGLRGVNLTIPHKTAVLAHLDEVRPDAALMGAVNTVVRDGDRLVGWNTDGKGFMRALAAAGVEPRGQRVVLLGAGGAARAIAVELALAGARRITVVNRSEDRGFDMVRDLMSQTIVKADFVELGEGFCVRNDVDILVNATPVGLYPQVTEMPLVTLDSARPDLLVCDAVPNPPETRLIATARGLGLRVLSGLSMLVYQGAIGFEMWTGQKPDEGVMKQALAAAFAT